MGGEEMRTQLLYSCGCRRLAVSSEHGNTRGRLCLRPGPFVPRGSREGSTGDRFPGVISDADTGSVRVRLTLPGRTPRGRDCPPQTAR